MSSSPSPSSALASTDAPPMPSRPGRRAEEDDGVADAGRGRLRIMSSLRGEPERHRVDEAVGLVGRLEVDLAADRRHADRVAVVADARDGAVEQVARALARSGSPKRSESSTAIGRAPSAKMSRRIPPTPVAAPWKGSTALGWLCDSTLNATAQPSPTSTAPAFSPGPMTTRAALGGQRAQQLLGVLVGAVLAPQQARTSPARPRWARGRACRTTSAYSSRVRPSATACSTPGSVGGVRHGADAPRRLEQLQPVGGAAQQRRPRARDAASGRRRCRPRCRRRRCRRSEPLGFWPGA